MQPTLDRIVSKLNAISASYYRLTNKRHRLLSDANYERGTKSGRASDYCGGIFFQRRRFDLGYADGLTS